MGETKEISDGLSLGEGGACQFFWRSWPVGRLRRCDAAPTQPHPTTSHPHTRATPTSIPCLCRVLSVMLRPHQYPLTPTPTPSTSLRCGEPRGRAVGCSAMFCGGVQICVSRARGHQCTKIEASCPALGPCTSHRVRARVCALPLFPPPPSLSGAPPGAAWGRTSQGSLIVGQICGLRDPPPRSHCSDCRSGLAGVWVDYSPRPLADPCHTDAHNG